MKGTFFPAVEDVFGRWRLPVVSNCRSTGLPVGWVTHLLGPQHRVSISSGRGVWVSAGGHYLLRLIHAISCSLGSKNGNALHNVPTVVRCCPTWHSARLQKIPWARGPAQIILINCGTEQPQLPQRHQDSNIHIPTHQHKRPKCISIHKEHAKTLIFNTTSNSLYTLY